MRVDMHMHSTCSDGSDSVEEIIDKAKARGLELICITDHDNANGQQRAIDYAKGKIGYITGIELSTYKEMEIHILGYGYDHNADIIKEKSYELLHLREIRIRKILEKLREQRVYVSESDLDMNFAGRLQIARVMVKRGYVSSTSEAFNRYLGADGSAYIPSNRLLPKDAVDIIIKAGGAPVIAHPEKYMNAGILEGMIEELKPLGLKGLECHYSSHSKETEAKLVAIAKKYDLIETVGSDYHGKNGTHDIGEVVYDMQRETLERLIGRSI